MLFPAPARSPCRVPRDGVLCSTTVFSHSRTVVMCSACSTLLCTPTGGKAQLSQGALPLPRARLARQLLLARTVCIRNADSEWKSHTVATVANQQYAGLL